MLRQSVAAFIALVAALVASLALAACGTKGPLTLPPAKNAVTPAPAPAAPLPNSAPAPALLPSTIPLPSTAPPSDAVRPPDPDVTPGNGAPK